MGESNPGGNPNKLYRPAAQPPGIQPPPLHPPANKTPTSYVATSGQAVAKLAAMASKPVEDAEPIELIGEHEMEGESKIRALGSAANTRRSEFNRQPAVTGRGACRVRTFHGRLSDEGLSYMDEKINEWLDRHPEIEVKFVTSTVGTVDGKIKEPALVMNVWY